MPQNGLRVPFRGNLPTMNSSLRDRTLDLLQNRSVKITLRKIAEDTGLPEGWLSAFHTNSIDEPSVNKVQTLYEYLTNSKLI